jgi:hypothetical protein
MQPVYDATGMLATRVAISAALVKFEDYLKQGSGGVV